MFLTSKAEQKTRVKRECFKLIKQRKEEDYLTYMNCLDGRFIDLPEMLINGFELVKLL